jgi:endonuclease YncB( thermonuclease family)
MLVCGLGLLWLCLLWMGCDRAATAEAPVEAIVVAQAHADATEPEAALARPRLMLEQEGLVIGEFRLAAEPVVDGDTIRVEGIDDSIRLLSIDTEERFRSKADRAAAAKDFERYLKRKRGNSPRPRKPGTPMGDQARRFARSFFEGVELVRLERDDPKEIRERYGRLLAHAFVRKNGRWKSYNVECVREGMSPYFTKYGYSHRFHNDFARAEAEAREAKRGIWSPGAKGYGDYDERKAWWDARAEFIRAFEHKAGGRDDYVELAHWDALARLEQRIDEEVTVLSTVDRIQRFKRLVKVSLARRERGGFPIIFFEREVFKKSGIDHYGGEPVMVRGVVERYEKGSYRTLQIVVTEPEQVSLPSLPSLQDTALATE